MKRSYDRRSFFKISALFGFMFGFSGFPRLSKASKTDNKETSVSGNPSITRRDATEEKNLKKAQADNKNPVGLSKKEKIPGKSRIAAIQSNNVPACEGLISDPFLKGFSMDDLLQSIELKIQWYEKLFDKAAGEQCDLVVLTEDFTGLSAAMQYIEDRSIFRTAVQRQSRLIPERISRAASNHKMYIVACYFTFEKDKIYNVADLFGRDGELVGRYKKVHLPQYELWQVTPGDSFPAFKTDIGWVSMLICYDQSWPEAASCCAMNGAQLICQPSAASLTDFHMKSRAKDNLLYHISSTWKNSMIVSPSAEVIADAESRDPAIIWADVDLQNSNVADEYYWEYLYSGIKNHKERHLKFRRPDTYNVLTQARPPLYNQYPEGGVANSPEEIERVYRILKEMRRKQENGEHMPYHWRW